VSRADRVVRALEDRIAPETAPPEEDLAVRFARVRGIAPQVSVSAQDISDDDVRTWLADPVAFIRDLAPLTLLPYQEDMVRAIDGSPYVVLLCARQIGKSTVASYYATWHAFTHPSAIALIIAAVERQAALDLEMVRAFVLGRPALAASLVELSQTSVRLSNGSRIYSLPAGAEGSTIRGFAADVVVMDEASRIPEEVFTAVLPMIATKAAPRFVLVSTPRGRLGFLYQATRNPLWKVVRFTAEDSPLIAPGYLERMRATLSEESYAMEFRAEFIDEATSAFPFALLDDAEDPDLVMET
jgi:terminase large subunit-like protein